ncbi:MAG: hypothetical protein DHS20C01_12690 [marine bacterium B5-7]|nr:MAG: hypothetical protein DHS20C01_12690 [marine bacterium B5-7]
MLVRFSTSVYADITMFGDVAKRLLDMMGHGGSIPGAIRATDIPEALEKLETELHALKEREGDDNNAPDDDDNHKVGLHHRSVPLINLLKAARDADAIVMWEKSGA